MCEVLDGDEMEEVLNSECKGDEMSKRAVGVSIIHGGTPGGLVTIEAGVNIT